MPSVYNAVTTVLVESQVPELIDIHKVLSQEQYEKDYLETQASILCNRTSVAGVIQAVVIEQYAFFRKKPAGFLVQMSGRLKGPAEEPVVGKSSLGVSA